MQFRDSRRAASRRRSPAAGASSASGEKGTISAPAARQVGATMRIEEGEGGVLGERDALAGRRQGAVEIGRARRERRGQRQDARRGRASASTMSASRSRCAIEVGMLAGLHQAEMALRQRQRGIAQDGADDRQAERLDGLAGKLAVPLAAEPVEHDAGDAHRRVVGRQSPWRRPPPSATGRKRRAPAAPAGRRAARGRRPRRSGPAPAGMPSNRPMALSMTTMSASVGGLAGQRAEQAGRHRPAVEIDAGQAGGGGVEAGIDVVRARIWRRAPASPRRASARSRPMVTLVLPEPERGAPMMMARAVMPRRPQLLAHGDDAADDDQRRRDDMLALPPPRPACRAWRPRCAPAAGVAFSIIAAGVSAPARRRQQAVDGRRPCASGPYR